MSLRPLMRPLYGSGKTLPQLILPDDVLSDDLENAAEGRVALPSDDNPSNDECPSETKTCQLSAATAANLCLRPCPCTHGCLGDLNDADLEDITKMREKFKGKDGNNVFFNMVKAVTTATSGKDACDSRKWAIFWEEELPERIHQHLRCLQPDAVQNGEGHPSRAPSTF